MAPVRPLQRWTAIALMLICCATIAVSVVSPRAAAQDNKTPYWASIDRVPAIMRRGPSEQLPALWQYVREDLPVRIIAVRGTDWRLIEDPAGTRGWMHRRLLSGRATAIVVGGVRPMRSEPQADAPVAFRAEPGVVGRLSECSDQWCLFDVHGQSGWILRTHIWGGGGS